MRRRDFIKSIAVGAVAWPLATRAQQAGKVYRIGLLAGDPTIPMQPAGQAFLDGLREGGFFEGKNITIERRFTEGRYDRYAEFASELVRLNVDVIVTSANETTLAVKRATSKIPVVMMNVTDPLGSGIVASLARPEGNITGVSQDDSAEIAAKRMQLLKDAVPHTAQVVVLTDTDLPDKQSQQAQWRQLEHAARSLNLSLRQFVARRASEFEDAFAAIAEGRPNALLVINSPLYFVNRKLIAELAAKKRLPTMSPLREFTEVGGLMSYGSVRVESFRRAAIYVGKILKGAKPAELPVEQPTKYELVINLKTAKALNLEIPRDLLLVADEVIE
jgi:putative ABC transport system substrate-binding protein